MELGAAHGRDGHGRDPKYDVLFEPVQIGPKTLKNRFYQVPHCIGAGSEKPGFQAYHRAMKAEGGWAAVCTEYCSIHPESDDTMRVSARIWDEGDVRNLAFMCDRAHAFGALAGVELWYGGPHAPCMESRHTPRGPSQIPSDFEVNTYPRYMDKDDIRLVQRYYVEAAIRSREAGFDIIYVYGAHSYLPLQFLTPYYNRRTDEYGGSFENRARFWKETLEQVREAVGDDCAIASRFAVDDPGPTGIKVGEEGIRFVEHVDHLVDLWDLTVGNIAEWGQNAGPSRFFAQGHERPHSGPVKAGNHTTKPVVGVGRVTDPDMMVDMIESGEYDIIGAARPSISDPFLPNKIAEGRIDEIRRCIGCNQCISRWEIGGPPMICTQNATAGEEYRRGWHPERFTRAKNADRRVLIVGGGIAGMECAIVLGKRGMAKVDLVEAESDVGGSINYIHRLGYSRTGGSPSFRGGSKGLDEFYYLVSWRKDQLARLDNVEVHTNRRLDAQAIRDWGADIVVIATGAAWRTDGLNPATHEPIEGADATLPWQATPKEIALGTKRLRGRVLVYETEAYHMGASMCQKLASDGCEVFFLTPAQHFMDYMEYTLEAPMMHRDLHQLGVKMLPNLVIEKIEPGHVTAYNTWHEIHKEHFAVDGVVLVTQRSSNDGLYHELKGDGQALKQAGVESLYLIGDASSPRMPPDAIFDGHRLAREIDSPNPAIPLPFIRERRLYGATSDQDYEVQLQGARDSASVLAGADGMDVPAF
jgi:dimethylamine/trimethylamine dehydrogenase